VIGSLVRRSSGPSPRREEVVLSKTLKSTTPAVQHHGVADIMSSHLHEPHPDEIADCVLDKFDALAQKFKPRTLADGRREWSPLAGIVLSRRKCRLS